MAIEKPQYPDLPQDPPSWVTVDEVIYANQSPWPAAADATGLAIHRQPTSLSGNDPANWLAGPPSPGQAVSQEGDTDGDGMPDSWETAHGLDPKSAGDAALDQDGDGLTNWQEYLSGTDPRNPQSFLKIEAVNPPTGVIQIRFWAVAGKSYTVQYSEAIAGSFWLKLLDVPAESAARVVDVPVELPPAGSQRFYRLLTLDCHHQKDFIFKPWLLFWLAFLLASSSQAALLISTNSVWKYRKGTNEVSSPSSLWRTNAFDDSSWTNGMAPFYYDTGGGISGNTLLNDMRTRYTCIFPPPEFCGQQPAGHRQPDVERVHR